MSQQLKITFIALFAGMVTLFFFPSSLNAQITSKPKTETLVPKDSVQTIGLPDISTKAAEDASKIQNILSTVISDADIDTICTQNDDGLEKIHTSIQRIDSFISNTKSIRRLYNMSSFILDKKKIIDDKKSDIKGAIKKIDAQLQYLSAERTLWSNTLKYDESNAPVVKDAIKGAINLIDQANTQLTKKNNKLLTEMDKSTQLSLFLKAKLADIDTELAARGNPFNGERISTIFTLDYFNPNSWSVIAPVALFYQASIKELIAYFSPKLGNLFFIFFLFFVLLFIFKKYKNRFEAYKPGYGEWYKKHLNLMLVRYISSAIVLSVFVSYIAFFDRPLIVRDLIGYLIIIPLSLILKTLVDRRFHRMISMLPFFMLPYTLYIIFSAEDVIFRINLLVMSVFQIVLLYLFISELKKIQFSNITQKNLLSFLAYSQLIAASISFIASIFGYVVISQSLMFAVYSNIVFGCSLLISTVLLNGFFLNLIESRRLQNKLHFIKLFEHTLKTRFVTIINLLAGIIWFYLFCSSLNMSKFLVDCMDSFFTNKHSFGSMSFTIGNFLAFFVVIYVSVLISNVIRAILEEDILNKMSLSKGLPHTIAIMTRYAIISFGVILAFSLTGVETTKFMVVLSAFGVGIGFGLQNIFNNLVSGFILLFERPIQLGDMIEVGPLLGKVKSIGIRSSNIETVDGAEVIVPNGQLVSSEVVNWTLSNKKKRIEILVGIGYDSNTQYVRELIEGILAERNDILLDPAPVILFNNIGDSSLNFRILFWTGDFGQAMILKSDVTFRLYDVLRDHGIEMPFAQHDIHFRTVDEPLLNRIIQSKE